MSEKNWNLTILALIKKNFVSLKNQLTFKGLKNQFNFIVNLLMKKHTWKPKQEILTPKLKQTFWVMECQRKYTLYLCCLHYYWFCCDKGGKMCSYVILKRVKCVLTTIISSNISSNINQVISIILNFIQ